MSILQAIILGIIQGITEFLPISSSAHLKIVPLLLNWDIQSVSFDLVLHAGSLFAVLIGLNKDILNIIKADFAKIKDKKPIKSMVVIQLVVATLPAVVIALFFRDQIENLSNGNVSMAIGLISVGVLFLFLDKISNSNLIKSISDINFKNSLFIGLAQPLAFLRGVSRSGITISAGILSGLRKEPAIRFSFLLSAVLLMGTSLVTFYEILQGEVLETTIILFTGFISSFLASLMAIKGLLKILKTGVFKYFGIYRIIIGILLIVLA